MLQVAVKLPTSAVNVTLLAFAAAAPVVQQSDDISRPPGPQQQTRCTLGQTDRRIPYRYIVPARHTIRAVPINLCIALFSYCLNFRFPLPDFSLPIFPIAVFFSCPFYRRRFCRESFAQLCCADALKMSTVSVVLVSRFHGGCVYNGNRHVASPPRTLRRELHYRDLLYNSTDATTAVVGRA